MNVPGYTAAAEIYRGSERRPGEGLRGRCRAAASRGVQEGGGATGRAGPALASAANDRRPVLDQPVGGRGPRCGGRQRHRRRLGPAQVQRVMTEAKQIEGGSGIAGMLGHKGGERGLPNGGRGERAAGASAVDVERLDHLRSREARAEQSGPQVSFGATGGGVACDHEVAGAATDQETDTGPRGRVEVAKRLLLRRRKKVGGDAGGQHRPHLGEGERAGEIEEVAHNSVKSEK